MPPVSAPYKGVRRAYREEVTLPRPRAAVAAIPRYVAGRPPLVHEGITSYKLSSNENPCPPLPEVVDAIARAAAECNRYPDMGSAVLLDALSVARGVPPDRLAVGTGSSALIYGLLCAFCGPGDEVVYPWRSFEAYPIAVAAAGATPVPVANAADGRHDVDGLIAALTPVTRVLILCSPNNPTGPVLTRSELARLMAAVPSDVLVLLDEAYAEFVRRPDAARGIEAQADHANLVALRTFSKAHGLAGLRVGYAVGTPEIVAAVRGVLLPFGVSGVAEAAAVAALKAEEQLLDRVDAIVAERERVLERVRGLGWEVPEAEGNFWWLPLTGAALDAFVGAAEEVGVSVRPLGGEGARVTVGEQEANDRVIEVLERLERPGG